MSPGAKQVVIDLKGPLGEDGLRVNERDEFPTLQLPIPEQAGLDLLDTCLYFVDICP